ncbi:hypothetical protein [Methylomonas methanica]|uniref:Adenosine deaminase n=1 Tax=Methylomonas methanica TaxID=421 RepID=A0A177MKV2_METMH|nr:hypothetical protein [Methylomonas methanica]OAI06222.1 hypothetical protein A1332_01585 [Methylomonas methanica]
MIPAPLSLLARTLQLADVELLDMLMRRLLSPSDYSGKASLHTYTPRAIEANYPRHFRLNDAQLAARRVEQDNGDDKDGLDWLDVVFDEYFRFDGDHVTAREDRRLYYARLCAHMHPALPVAWRLSGLMRKNGDSRLTLDDMRRVVGATAPNFLPTPAGNAAWADLHVHLGGSAETSLSLFHMAISRWVLPNKTDLPSRDHDRLDRARVKQWIATYQTLFYQILNRLCIDGDSNHGLWKKSLSLAWTLGQPDRPSVQPRAWLDLHRRPTGRFGGLAYSAIACYDEGDAQRAWLYWLTALCGLFRDASSLAERDAVLAFFNLAHLFRRDMIHDGVGLTRFVRYFNSPLRMAPSGKHREKDGLRQLLGHPRHLAELKVTDWIADKEAATNFAKQSTQLLYQPDRNERPDALQVCLERMHICIHFVRGASKDNANTLRYEAQRRKTLLEAQKIERFLRSTSAARTRIDGVVVDLTTLIRGLDVAGDELATPIEVFAPAIRSLRHGPLRSAVQAPRPPMHRLHLSIHAGEDYNHLLGGMRHLDETVKFCEMGQHDRLGHALALGIRPVDWINRQPEVLLTVEEHLDNLVWAWAQALILTGLWPGAEAVALRLEARIRIYAPMVYPNHGDQLTPDALYRAWFLRRNCPIKWREYRVNAARYSGLEYWVPDVYSSDVTVRGLAHQLYDEYHRLRNRPTHEADQHGQVVLIKQGNGLPSYETPLDDWLSEIELDFMEAVQDRLLDEYAQRGLIIEVNPSSNVYIGRIEDYHQHPVFRWHPPRDEWLKPKNQCNRFGLRRGAMQVCVNTDDPGIFPTSLPNELQLLLEAAQNNHGIGPLEAARWVDELRQFGVDQFIRAHISKNKEVPNETKF